MSSTVWVTIALHALGGILIIADVVLPSLGLLSLAGVALFVWGYIQLWGQGGYLSLAVVLVADILLGILYYQIFVRLMGKSPFVLRQQVGASSSYKEDSVSLEHLVGKQAVTLNTLRPSGHVRIDSKRFDVVSAGEYIGSGARVIVIAVEGNRIVVAPFEEQSD